MPDMPASERQFFPPFAIDYIILENQARAANAAIVPAPVLSNIDELPAGMFPAAIDASFLIAEVF